MFNLKKKDTFNIDHVLRPSEKVEDMFSNIARRYDLLNHLLSFGFDFLWRKTAAKETLDKPCNLILDVCTGTADMAIELCKVHNNGTSINGIDFSMELMNIGLKKTKKAYLNKRISFICGDAEKLPFKDKTFDAITITFGLRNIQDRFKALKEFYRVTKDEGIFVCLEFSQPVNKAFFKLYYFYLSNIVPFISKVVGSNPSAYIYLKNTILDFPSPEELCYLIEKAGWKNTIFKRLTGGIVTIHKAYK
jgi:demethylmenaquinone methyltransferase/2-methoxy-6-polyprenyl-1,4-benzoquinol methylase